MLLTVWKSCYNGYGRGFLTEAINCVGAVVVTVVTINYAGVMLSLVSFLTWPPIPVLELLVFWGLFIASWFGVRWLRLRIAEVIRWEKFHWFIQGLGLFLGGLRGLWWAGFLLIVISSSGYQFLRDSVETNSVLGQGLTRGFRTSLDYIAEYIPGAQYRDTVLVPSVQAAFGVK